MARDSNGTFTLTSGNPVVSGTTIEVAWANTTLADIATEITKSLSRNGNGGMLAPLRLTDGTVTAPAISYTSEQNSGFYRAGAGDLRYAAGGVDVMRWRNTGTEIWNFDTGEWVDIVGVINSTNLSVISAEATAAEAALDAAAASASAAEANEAISSIPSIVNAAVLAADTLTVRPNLIINSDFKVNQRYGTTAMYVNYGVYLMDRFKSGSNVSASYKVTRPSEGDAYTGHVRITPGIVGSTAYIGIRQDIDTDNLSNIATLTFSCWVRTNLTGVKTRFIGSSEAYGANEVPNTGVWTKIVETFNLVSGAAYGVAISHQLTPGLVSVDQYIETKEWKLEVGSEASEYYPEDYAVNLVRCKHFYEVIKPPYYNVGYMDTTDSACFAINYATKRDIPTVSKGAGTWYIDGSGGATALTFVFSDVGLSNLKLRVLGIDGITTAGVGAALRTSSGTIILDSELA